MSLPNEEADKTAAWHRLHPAMLLFEAGRILRRLFLPLLIGGFAVSRQEGGFRTFIIVSAVISVFGFASSYLSFRYRLTADGIELHEGVFTRRKQHIALARISHVSTHQNALARLIGVVRLDIATEGGGERAASFAALSVGAAEKIRQHVGEASSVSEEENILYAASLRDRVLAGATTLQVGGAIAMGFLAWRYIRRLDGGDGLESDARPEVLNSVIVFVDELLGAISASPALITLSIFALVSGIWALSIVVSIVRWHGFRIIERGAELHRQSGVFSRSRNVIARDRIQAVEVHGSLVRNLLGFAQIAIVAAGSGGRGRGRGRGHSRIFIPLSALDRVSDYVQTLWPQIREEFDWRPIHPYYRRQHINRGLFLLLPLTIVALNVVPLNAVTVVAIALTASGIAWLIWRTATPSFVATGFALRDGYLHVRTGAVSPRRWIVATSRIQAVILRTSLMQRRHDVTNVVIDVNGLASNQHIAIPNLPRAQAERMQMELTPHHAD